MNVQTALANPATANEPRFEFGRNWQAFLSVLNEDRIAAAERSLQTMLGVETLKDRSFLDIGSGSGLFSLAAMRLGASRVHSFDFDPRSVACTTELRSRYFPHDERWSIEVGNAVDERYVDGLGRWDVVYSWGALHHTGDMIRALDLASRCVSSDGSLFIAIYNSQGVRSTLWRKVKWAFNTSRPARAAIIALGVSYFCVGAFVRDIAGRRNPLRRYRVHARGMSPLHDWLDWLGGYPFEVATREQIVAFYTARGFGLRRLNSCHRKSGCNEFLFSRMALERRDSHG